MDQFEDLTTFRDPLVTRENLDIPTLTDDQRLLGFLKAEEQQALGYYTGVVSGQRASALDYFFGEPFGDEVEGRSQAVSTDVQDAVEGILPDLLRPFISGSDVVQFEPMGPQDEDAAEQESDYVNYIIMNRNDGAMLLYNWFKDALMQKNGYVRYWWEDEAGWGPIERYQGIDQLQLAYIIADTNLDDVQIIEATPYPDPQGGLYASPIFGGSVPQQPQMVYDITLRRVNRRGKCVIDNVPPEELLVSSEARKVSLKKCRFVQHRRRMTISQVRELGFDIPDDIQADQNELTMSAEYTARREADEIEIMKNEPSPENRVVMLRTSWYRIDYDGDGIAELREIIACGDMILQNEEVEEVPIATLCPFPIPHKHFGQSVADKTMDIQLIKSTLLRIYLDNLYTANNNRMAVSNQVNLDDILGDGLPGIVRVDSAQVGNDVVPIPTVPLGPIIDPMLQRMDDAKMVRVGYTPIQPELDANAISRTATGVQAQQTGTQGRQELMARVFAESGVKELMHGVHGVLRRHATKAETVRLRGKWVEIDPRAWQTRYDMTPSVGLGTGTAGQRQGSVMNLMALQKEISLHPNPSVAGMIQPQNIYNAASKYAHASGFKDETQFFSDPSSPEVQQLVAQAAANQGPHPDVMRAQAEVQKAQIAQQTSVNENAQQMQQMQLNALIEANNARLKMADMALKQREMDLKEKELMVDARVKLRQQQHQEAMGAHDIALRQGDQAMASQDRVDARNDKMEEQHETAKTADLLTAIGEKLDKLNSRKKIRRIKFKGDEAEVEHEE